MNVTIKKIIIFLLCCVTVAISFVGCNKKGHDIVLGKWYNINGDCLIIQSDNTYRIKFTETTGIKNDENGTWKFLEIENLYKFQSNNNEIWESQIYNDNYGAKFETINYGIFYKDRFPQNLIGQLKEDKESFLANVIECPKFVGMTIDEVKKNEHFSSFDIDWEYTANEEFDINIVCDQSQPDGKKLKKGAKITLYISTGKTNIKVPDVYGKTESYAISVLKSMGFVTTVKLVADDEVEEGRVIKTDPVRTTVVAEGAEITVFVSTGKE